MKSPYTIKFFGAYCDEKYVHLVMKCVNGVDMLEMFNIRQKQGVGFSEEEAKKHIRQCLMGISHLHAKNIVHRDLKLENLLYDKDTDRIILIDFGLARKK